LVTPARDRVSAYYLICRIPYDLMCLSTAKQTDRRVTLLMILDTESWMNVRRFRALHDAGASFVEIGRECGCDWRTVKKYLAEDASSAPPMPPQRTGTQPLLITPLIPVVEAWLRADVSLKGTVIHERLVAEYGFTGHYQRVKMFLAEARPRIAAELTAADDNPLTGLHRRFEVVAGACAWKEPGRAGVGAAVEGGWEVGADQGGHARRARATRHCEFDPTTISPLVVDTTTPITPGAPSARVTGSRCPSNQEESCFGSPVTISPLMPVAAAGCSTSMRPGN
jgi:hypothetical protein